MKNKKNSFKAISPSPLLSLAILAAALAFIAFGIFRGEMALVLQKAINICLECIGIG